jgi:arylsulfatase A-like enzyme
LIDSYAAPSWTPTRAALITGRYYQRTGLEAPLPAAPAGGRGLAATGHSLPQLMKNAGYATGLIGRWHLGYATNQMPRAHGFDYFFGFLSGVLDYSPAHRSEWGARSLRERCASTGGRLHDRPDHRARDAVYRSERATAVLSRSGLQRGALAVSGTRQAVSRPEQRAIRPAARGHTSTRADYAAILERADQGVGRIVDALQKHGLTRNTLTRGPTRRLEADARRWRRVPLQLILEWEKVDSEGKASSNAERAAAPGGRGRGGRGAAPAGEEK